MLRVRDGLSQGRTVQPLSFTIPPHCWGTFHRGPAVVICACWCRRGAVSPTHSHAHVNTCFHTCPATYLFTWLCTHNTHHVSEWCLPGCRRLAWLVRKVPWPPCPSRIFLRSWTLWGPPSLRAHPYPSQHSRPRSCFPDYTEGQGITLHRAIWGSIPGTSLGPQHH